MINITRLFFAFLHEGILIGLSKVVLVDVSYNIVMCFNVPT